MAVDTMLSSLADILPDYELIRDCVAGQREIKKKGEKYLPTPDPDEPDKLTRENRYKSYLLRAVFYGVTGRTLRGLVGLVFDKDPAVEVPDLLKPVLVDASGSGMSLDQQAQKCLYEVVGVGRAGLLADYPKTDGPTTRADAIAGNIRPTITLYKAEQVINWRTKKIGSKVMLTLVVIREQFVVEDDGFAETCGTQYRVLRLDAGGVYTVELWRDIDQAGMAQREFYTPTDGAGKPLREIPFTFVGAEDNDPDIDRPPLLDIAEINKAHYLNSADYEESVFIVGQPTPVFAGLTKQWVEDVFSEEVDDGHGNKRKRSTVRLGSRAAIPLPAGGSAELLQAQPNTMAMEAMTHKEAQMIALGAKLIENTGTQQTATEATYDAVMDNSVLGTAARNVSKAYRQCLTWAHLFNTGQMVDDDKIIDYVLSTDFVGRSMTAADRTEIVGEWVKGAITWDEMRWNLKRSGVAYEDDEEAKETIASAKEDTMAFEAEAAKAMAAATGNTNTPPSNAA